MAPRRVRLVRLALLAVVGVTVLLVAVLSLLRPAVATGLLAGVAAVALFEAGVGRWRRGPRDDDRPQRSLRGAKRVLAVAAAAITAAISATQLLRDRDASPGIVPSPPQVTVPYEATARLAPRGWEVREEIRVDDAAIQGLHDHGGLSGADVVELLHRLPLGTGWQLERMVDGTPVFVRGTVVTVEERRLGVTRAVFEVPQVPVLGVELVPRSESSAILLAPRAAVAATTPPADEEILTADEGGIARSVVPVDDSTDEVTVALLGTWLRSPFGERLYDLSTWPLLPYVVGVIALAVAARLRRWILARFVAVSGRLRRSRGSGDEARARAPVDARRIPRPRPGRSRVAGARRRQDRGR
ncbi:hypothetical protein [Blastococcus deserti]|uniref:Uncharacterized protein n=1 Tax=Blastococcus deserti TaxID=2259033 RepID=A0ABW4XEY6_9ACTN